MSAARGGIVALASLIAGAIATSCGSFSDGDTPVTTNDGGADDAANADAPATADAANADAPAGTGECESVRSEPLVPMTGVRNIGADSLHVYAATTTGVLRVALAPDGGAPETFATDPVTDVVLTNNYVVYRSADGVIRTKDKTALAASPGTAFSIGAIALGPSTQDDFVVVRSGDVYGCTAPGPCQGIVLQRAVRDVVARGASFDFLADEGGGVAVYHCASSCTMPNAGTHLAAGGADVPDLVSDVDHLYWIDRNAGSVRRVPRAGGVAVDVMTGLLAPSAIALDGQSRILVGTAANGVYRGSVGGTCRATPHSGDVVVALTVGPTGAFIGTAAELRKLLP